MTIPLLLIGVPDIMKNITTGLYTVFTELTGGAHNAFYNSIGGRLYDTLAPDGAEMPFAVYLIIAATDDDTFSENMLEVLVQFSLFSNASGSTEIKNMDTYLTSMLKDKVFSVTGWTVATTLRVQANGPYIIEADEAAGVGKYWQTNIDFVVYVSKS
jgi:hypothetical protein